MTARKTIEDFLGSRRLAVVGVSRNPRDFTRTLFRELQKRGYELIPVHPQAAEIEAVPTVAHIQDVSPPVEAALLLTTPSVTPEVIRECQQAGVHRVWIYRAGTAAAASSTTEFCAEHGMDVVSGECPFMFLPDTGFPHNFHGFCRKLVGRYPQ